MEYVRTFFRAGGKNIGALDGLHYPPVGSVVSYGSDQYIVASHKTTIIGNQYIAVIELQWDGLDMDFDT